MDLGMDEVKVVATQITSDQSPLLTLLDLAGHEANFWRWRT
jgi:hypothetical protein